MQHTYVWRICMCHITRVRVWRYCYGICVTCYKYTCDIHYIERVTYITSYVWHEHHIICVTCCVTCVTYITSYVTYIISYVVWHVSHTSHHMCDTKMYVTRMVWCMCHVTWHKGYVWHTLHHICAMMTSRDTPAIHICNVIRVYVGHTCVCVCVCVYVCHNARICVTYIRVPWCAYMCHMCSCVTLLWHMRDIIQWYVHIYVWRAYASESWRTYE